MSEVCRPWGRRHPIGSVSKQNIRFMLVCVLLLLHFAFAGCSEGAAALMSLRKAESVQRHVWARYICSLDSVDAFSEELALKWPQICEVAQQSINGAMESHSKSPPPMDTLSSEAVRAEAVQVLNRRFGAAAPDAEEIAATAAKFSTLMQKLDDAVLRAVANSSKGGDAVHNARSSVLDAIARVRSLGSEAATLEAFVETIRQETRAMENAKESIPKAYKGLEQLKLLVTNVALLEDFASRRSYSECCSILEAVYSLWTNFAPIANHPRLYKLSIKMTEIRILLKSNCINDIRNFSSTHSCSDTSDLTHACSILNILGFSSECMSAWTDDILRSLPSLRPPKSDPASSQWTFGPDDISRVCDWFFATLEDNSLLLVGDSSNRIPAIFPSVWKAAEHFAHAFFSRILADMKRTIDASTFLKMQKGKDTLLQIQSTCIERERQINVELGSGTLFCGALSSYLSGLTGNSDIGMPAVVESDDLPNIVVMNFGDLDDDELPQVVNADEDDDDNPAVVEYPLPDDVTRESEVEAMEALLSFDSVFEGMEEQQVQYAVYETLLLCTELDEELANDQEMALSEGEFKVLDEMRSTCFQISMGKNRQLRTNARISVPPVNEDDPPFISSALSPEMNALFSASLSEPPRSTSIAYRIYLLQHMRPRRFRTGAKQEDFKSWRQRQTAFVLCACRAILAELSRSQPKGKPLLFQVKGEGEQTADELLTSLHALAHQICALFAHNTEQWERVIELPYSDAVMRFSYHCAPLLPHLGRMPMPRLMAAKVYEMFVSYMYSPDDGRMLEVHEQNRSLSILAHVRKSLYIPDWLHFISELRSLISIHVSFEDIWPLEFVANSRLPFEPIRAAEPALSRTCRAIIIRAETILKIRLCDARAYHTSDPQTSIPVAIDCYFFLRRLRLLLQGRSEDYVSQGHNEVVCLFAKNSSANLYRRMRKDHQPDASESLPPDSAHELVKVLTDEVKLEADFFNLGWKEKSADALMASVGQLLQRVTDEVTPWLQEVRSLDTATVLLWQSAVGMQRVCWETCRVSNNGLSILFSPLVESWMETQKMTFTECKNQALRVEEQNRWRTLDDATGSHRALSSSAIDLFSLFSNTIPNLFELGVPISVMQARNLCESVDIVTSTYANDIKRQCGSIQAFKPNFRDTEEDDEKDKVTLKQIGRRVANMGKEAENALKDTEKKFLEAVDAVLDKDESRSWEKELGTIPPVLLDKPKKLLDLETTSMVVRLNCLLFAEEELVKLEKLIIERYQRMLTEHQDALQQAQKDDGGDSDDSDSGGHSLSHMSSLFNNSITVLDASIRGTGSMAEVIAAKVVWFDLRDDFIIRMYAPTPSKYRLIDILEGGDNICGPLSLSDILVSIKRHCGDDNPFFRVLLGAIFRSICEAVETVLLRDRGTVRRTIDMDDASLILEDMDYLKDYFVQDGDGIDEADAVEWGRRIQQLVLLMDNPSSVLIDIHSLESTPVDHDRNLTNKNVIFKILSKRNDKEAIDFVKEKAAEGNIAKKGILAMEKSAAVVADSLGITKGIDLMKDAGKVTGGMMKTAAKFTAGGLGDIGSAMKDGMMNLGSETKDLFGSAFKSDDAEDQASSGGGAKPPTKPKKRGSIFNIGKKAEDDE